ncbi:MAG: hypothetical protein KBA75_08905 [Alphaproteobacteria bacterium]|nr:hypothetical protein [Alphaproteobacteria bacterium]
MAEQPTSQQASATPSALPQRGVAGVFGAVLAGIAVGILAWAAIVKGNEYPLLIGFILVMPVPLFLVGLGVGRGDMLVAAVVAMASLTFALNVEAMLFLTAVYVLPVLLLCLLALRHRYDERGTLFWYPTGRLVTALILYPIVIYGCFSVMIGGQGVEHFLQEFFTPIMNTWLAKPEIAKSLPVAPTPDFARQIAVGLVALLPGMMILSWVVSILVSALWTQFTLLSNNNALRPVPGLDDFDIPTWLLPLFAIMILLSFFFEGQVAFYARNTLLPLTIPYFVLGVALFHLWAGRHKSKMLMLVLFYLFLSTGYPIVFVALAGVLEPWVHLRQRITGKTKSTL